MKLSALGGGSRRSHRHYTLPEIAVTTLVDAASWTASALVCYMLTRSYCFILGDTRVKGCIGNATEKPPGKISGPARCLKRNRIGAAFT
jgi:hypothetical protein